MFNLAKNPVTPNCVTLLMYTTTIWVVVTTKVSLIKNNNFLAINFKTVEI